MNGSGGAEIDIYRLTVAGPLPRTVTDILRDRFDGVVVRTTRTDTVLDEVPADQATLRALMTLLWDGGHTVIGITREFHQVQKESAFMTIPSSTDPSCPGSAPPPSRC